MTISFDGSRAKRIEDMDLPRIGAMIGVGEDEIHAVMEVEASGSGFDKQGRIKMLFEPHLFYRRLSGAARDRAVREGLAYDGWRPGQYPPDSYPRLQKAMMIDETVALKSASWGLGQLLGSNHRAAGYATPQAMIADFIADEDNHLEAMIRFIKSDHLDDEIRAHNWAAFARGYNGPGYAKNGYDKKLKAAYAKWAKIKNTAWKPENDTAPSAVNIPVEPPTMAKSREGNTAILTGGAGTLIVANEAAKQIKDSADTFSGLLDAMKSPTFLIATVIIVAAGAIWFFRRQRMKEHGV